MPGTDDIDWGEPTYEDASKINHPVVCVNWHEAQAYCKWAGARLPTEAEWEYAARGKQGHIYPWGDAFDVEQLNFCDASCDCGSDCDWRVASYDDGYERTSPVGSFQAWASWCGSLDMAGNVWEWVADWYGDYSSGQQVNPRGPSSGQDRVLRGGSWIDVLLVRSAECEGVATDARNSLRGSRCAQSPE